MKTVQLTFSIRDWKRGQQLLLQLGHIDQEWISESWELELEDWQIEDLKEEIENLGLEHELRIF